MDYSYLIVPIGALIGTFVRWKISLAWNPVIAYLPLGTLIVNLVGGYLIGFLMGIPSTTLALTIRSYISIGLLGGLTTFSAFSAETVTLLLAQQYKYALLLITSHLFGSLLMTVAGVYTAAMVFGVFGR